MLVKSLNVSVNAFHKKKSRAEKVSVDSKKVDISHVKETVTRDLLWHGLKFLNDNYKILHYGY